MNGTAQDEITFYVDAVGACLGDLPATVRHELLEDLPEHLAEVQAEGIGSLVGRLGPPQVYAAELRAAAGVVGGFPDPPPRPDRIAAVRAGVLRTVDRLDLRTGPLLGHSRASDFLHLLRPAWWVLRGYLAAMVLAYLLDDSGQPIGLLPRIGGSEVVALLLLAGTVLASVWLGRRPKPQTAWPRYALYSGTALLVLVAVAGFFDADSVTRGSSYADVNYDAPYADVHDVYVYDEQGRLLTGVRLFDQGGRPIRLGYRACAPTDGTTEEHDPTYPYCPENAPFRVPSATDRSAPASQDPAPQPSATAPAPQPSATAPAPQPSATAPAPPASSGPGPAAPASAGP